MHDAAQMPLPDEDDADLDDDNTYSDGRQVSIKIRVEPIEESVDRWEHRHFLLHDGSVVEYPRGITSCVSSPSPRQGDSMTAWFERDFLNRFYED